MSRGCVFCLVGVRSPQQFESPFICLPTHLGWSATGLMNRGTSIANTQEKISMVRRVAVFLAILGLAGQLSDVHAQASGKSRACAG